VTPSRSGRSGGSATSTPTPRRRCAPWRGEFAASAARSSHSRYICAIRVNPPGGLIDRGLVSGFDKLGIREGDLPRTLLKKVVFCEYTIAVEWKLVDYGLYYWDVEE
jgi:hypothetical protein